MADPSSRFRARWLAEHPAKGGESSELGFLGYSQDSALLIAIHNAVMAGHGKKARKAMLDGPKAKGIKKLFAPTIADFNTDLFMAVINGE